ncbi:hypothetical protein ANK2_1164 [plant metagenome]
MQGKRRRSQQSQQQGFIQTGSAQTPLLGDQRGTAGRKYGHGEAHGKAQSSTSARHTGLATNM